MKISEHAELRYLQKHRPRMITKPEEMSEICVSCPGKCKAPREFRLKTCGWQVREKAKGDR